MSAASHETRLQTFDERARIPGTSPMTIYLLHLMAQKRTNLCLSADVTTTRELLKLAEEVGDAICLLKTHVDIISDFGDRTVKGLKDIARRKRFLVFEDRKFGDIGSTVQKQYTAGPFAIAKWAEITNAHIFPGPAIVTALKQAAAAAIAAYNTAVHTEISVGSPPESDEQHPSGASDPESEDDEDDPQDWEEDYLGAGSSAAGRKLSVVSVSTTISRKTEAISPQPIPNLGNHASNGSNVFAQFGETPFLRAMLLVAEMSSQDNLLTPEYTAACVGIARQHRDFVMGFIAQRALNSQQGDNFITMTPGVRFPPRNEAGARAGDGLGQQYTDPRSAVLDRGTDVVIVGRGILVAEDRAAEAERYRKEAWRAYEERTRAAS